MTEPVFIGLDIGTSSSKGVACAAGGEILAQARRVNAISTPAPGHVEQDADGVWWKGVVDLCRLLMASLPSGCSIAGVCVTTMGPCLVPVDDAGRPLRPGILYGVDTRAADEIARMEARIGRRAIRRLGNMDLSSQSVGPKIAWLARHEPEVVARTARFHTATSYLLFRLTGDAVIDRHQACYFTPYYGAARGTWDLRHAEGLALDGRLPAVGWATDVGGRVSPEAAVATGLPRGVPVLVGTSDGPTEAAGVGGMRPGTFVLTYGSTAGLTTFGRPSRPPRGLWTSEGIVPGMPTLGGALSTSGAIVSWMGRELAREIPQTTMDEIAGAHRALTREAEGSSPGARGLLVLPYFSGERTPFADPHARGALVGLGLGHTRGDIARAVLEGVAFGVRHLLEAFAATAVPVERVRVAGGGTESRLAMQIVSDVTGLVQEVPAVRVGAAYGAAYLAALAAGRDGAGTGRDDWVRIVDRVVPDPARRSGHDARYDLFRRLYRDTRRVTHALAADQAQGLAGAVA